MERVGLGLVQIIEMLFLILELSTAGRQVVQQVILQKEKLGAGRQARAVGVPGASGPSDGFKSRGAQRAAFCQPST